MQTCSVWTDWELVRSCVPFATFLRLSLQLTVRGLQVSHRRHYIVGICCQHDADADGKATVCTSSWLPHGDDVWVASFCTQEPVVYVCDNERCHVDTVVCQDFR